MDKVLPKRNLKTLYPLGVKENENVYVLKKQYNIDESKQSNETV